jgi:SAM-dependent methyltransferase
VLTVDFDRLDLQPGNQVLDLGCGNGRHVLATRWLPGVTGVALDLGFEEVLATADTLQRMDERHPSEGGTVASSGRWIVIQGDVFHLPFPAGTFDCVIASEILEHLVQDGIALDEMHRVLRPGGLLVVSVPRYGPEAVCWALSDDYHSNEGGHIRIYRPRDLLGTLAEHGFEVFARHHAHALHSPYWWLRCAVGVRNEQAPPVRWYHGFLVWEMVNRPWITRALERVLNPLIGKSLVMYANRSGPI